MHELADRWTHAVGTTTYKRRLLQMGRRLTLGIGDNREHCFYVPVGFNLLRQYIDEGFELEELASIWDSGMVLKCTRLTKQYV